MAQRLAESALSIILRQEKLSPTRIVRKIRQRLNSKTVKTIAGEREVMADNDAQLTAAKLAIELQGRADLLPSDRQASDGGSITINVMVNSPDGRRITQVIDAEPVT